MDRRQPETDERAPSRYLWSAKRQHRRVTLDVPLIVKWDGTLVLARSLDLSEGGLGAKVRGTCSEGQTVELQFALDDSGIAMHVRAICKYSSDARHGFQFLDINPEQRETIAQLVKANKKKTAI
jgi:c-di-GMP-binding flagellar brake protein YcgR